MDWVDPQIGKLSVRVARTKEEIAVLRKALDQEHYLKAGRPAGHVLWQGVYEHDDGAGEKDEGKLCAVLSWAGAAWRLKDRDEWIDWDDVTRANRLALITQLRRFIVLEKKRRPNLASKSLGLALRQLPKQWKQEHGWSPLLAESFSDPESHAGTVYKVTNWQALGMTKGYGRHRSDFYENNKRPKKLWIKELDTKARQKLGSAAALPAVNRNGEQDGVAGARSPLKCKELRSLFVALRKVKDPRSAKSRRYPIGSMLSIICLGLLAGADNVMAIWRKSGPLSQSHRAALGLWRKDKAGRIKLPSYSSLVNLLAVIDNDELAKQINIWLAAHQNTLPRSLAIDGKCVGALKGGVITLCHHEDGAPVAMAAYEGGKDECEMPVARNLLEKIEPSLDGAVVTGDALHCQKKTVRAIVENGGDYFIALKENQPSIAKLASQRLDGLPPF